MAAVRTNSSSSNEERHSSKNNASLRKRLSSEETPKPTLLNEAASLVDGKPTVDDDNET